jgi:hypothetical protein
VGRVTYATEQGVLNEQMNVLIEATQTEMLRRKLLIVSMLGVKFDKDGDQYYYILGELYAKETIVGFGDTPMEALDAFCKMYGI